MCDKKAYMYRLFKEMWQSIEVTCPICYDKIENDGIVIVSEHATLNLEKMFHKSCLAKWYASTHNKQRDPFNRVIKYKFHFPPKTFEECSCMLDQIKGFIGDERADKVYKIEYERVNQQKELDIELDFDKLLKY
ncbi:hypothetical protein [Apocheima cinerarium nucleopolyhedrovirus]|uniref:hypothetical protein n=1 Tax=Apocheima cinerarium nucleopolyhedrovirus TaxID=307461 RepID=UPI0001D9204D|nr:hypothetical protein [Apocheima cinerarium nucleopolyhedrovirus]ADB84385.1 hypothetical protein [Apocheima cinerarium nucleopolyhedrovirus]